MIFNQIIVTLAKSLQCVMFERIHKMGLNVAFMSAVSPRPGRGIQNKHEKQTWMIFLARAESNGLEVLERKKKIIIIKKPKQEMCKRTSFKGDGCSWDGPERLYESKDCLALTAPVTP